MWKFKPTDTVSPSSNLNGTGLAPASLPSKPAARTAPAVSSKAILGKGLIVKGEITGSESLFIDGRAEGSINLPGCQVTVGSNASVTADITAFDVIVIGVVCGNIQASNRLDIRAQGAVTGNVTAAHLTIDDGAFFKGSIDILKSGTRSDAAAEKAKTVMEAPTTLLVVRSESEKLHMHPIPQSA